jgi:hypothetical protein
MLRGDHGQDPDDPKMHGIFVAAGPSFVAGLRVGRLPAVDVYNLLAAVLEVEPAPNDGDPAAIAGFLAD